MVVAVTDTDPTIVTVTTQQGLPLWEALNPHLTTRVTILTDISLMLHGVLVAMDHSMVTVAREVERVLL